MNFVLVSWQSHTFNVPAYYCQIHSADFRQLHKCRSVAPVQTQHQYSINLGTRPLHICEVDHTEVTQLVERSHRLQLLEINAQVTVQLVVQQWHGRAEEHHRDTDKKGTNNVT